MYDDVRCPNCGYTLDADGEGHAEGCRLEKKGR
jgi:hypothetical protein